MHLNLACSFRVISKKSTKIALKVKDEGEGDAKI